MFDAYVQPLTTWLHHHPEWAIVFSFVCAFGESLAIIGTIVPGAVTLTVLGILIGSGVIAPLPNIGATIIGAVLGDTLSFAVGKHYHQSIKTRWPFSRYPELLAKGERFFIRHGAMSIFIGRFFGPIRSILPLVVGMLNMPFRRFIVADILTAILWAPVYMLPGMMIGAAALEMTPDTATRVVLLILASILTVWLGFKLFRYTSRRLLGIGDQLLQAAWEYMLQHPRWQWLCHVMRDPRRTQHHGQLGLGLGVIFFAMTFLFIAIQVSSQGWLTQLNEPVFHFIQSLRTSWLDKIMLMITFCGDKYVLLPFACGVSLWLWQQDFRRLGLHFFSNAVLVGGLIYCSKHIMQFPRPEGFAVLRSSFSFPSGHSALSVAIIGFFAVIIHQHRVNKRLANSLSWAACGLIASILISRLYLGAHWLTDVLGAATLGLTCLCASTLSWQRNMQYRLPLQTTLTVSAGLFAVLWSCMVLMNFQKELAHNQPLHQRMILSEQQWWQQQTPILPMVRRNRFGHAEQYLTLQYQGDLTALEQSLAQQGWQSVPQYSIFSALSRLASADKTQSLPVIPKLYHHRPAVLMMIKRQTDKPLLVVRFWESGLTLKGSSRPVYIGAVNYRLIWKSYWLQKNAKIITNLTPALSVIAKDLSTFSQQEHRFLTPQMATEEQLQQQIRILLLKA